MTTAEKIAAQFRNDGQNWEDATGLLLETVCKQQSSVQRYGDGFYKHRFVFTDNSVITICGDGWDFGYPDCYCWQYTGHAAGCPYALTKKEEN